MPPDDPRPHHPEPPQREQLHDIGRRRAWAIWLVALSVYVLAVFHRSSLGVAGLLAVQRFGITATELAFFTVLQLLVYAGMQIPVGVLLDRFGARVMLLAGLVTMTAGQFAFAFATSFPLAVLARAVLGAGDAMVFVSVLRLVTAWFLVRQAPLVTQLTGQAGQLGAILAAGPLAWALHALGWTRTFALSSSVGVVLMVGVALLVKDSPYRVIDPVKVKMRALTRSLRTVWGNPGTRLGMWSHFTSPFSVTVFGMLWGYPFLVRGEGLSERAAGLLLMLMTGWVVVSGLVLGALVTRFPFYRSRIVVGVVGLIAAVWTAVLLQPGPSPLWLLILLVCTIATGGPASMVGFDLARSFTPQEATGRANGVVNIGGFLAALLTMALVGLVLDWREPGGMAAYDLDDFRTALSVQYVFWILGAVQILRYRRKAIDHLHRVHPGAVEQLKRGEPFVHPGFADQEGV
ncbi:MAG: MFS transporter [Nocardioidaceae bacterium]